MAHDQFEINVDPEQRGYKRTPLGDALVLVDGASQATRLGAALAAGSSGIGSAFSTTAKVGDSRLGYHVIGGVLNTVNGPVVAPNDSFNLNDNATSYIGPRFDGVWQTNTVGWNNGGQAVYPCQKVVVVSGVITSITDYRPFAEVLPIGAGSGTVTSVTAGTGLTGGTITSSGTIGLANTTVTPGTYGDSTHVGQFTVDQQGRLVAASSVAISGGGGSLPNALTLGSEMVPTDLVGTWVAAQGILNAANPIFGNISASPRPTIQAALDYAITNSIMITRIPGTRATSYVLDGPLFVDPSNNMRNGISLANQKLGITAAPTVFLDRFMTVLVDAGVIIDGSGWSTSPTVWLGTQNRQVWDGGAFKGPVAFTSAPPVTYARNYPILCTGISIAAGNGGAVYSTIRNVDIAHYYNGIATGQNGQDSLAEGNLIDRCRITSVFNCVKIYNSQAYPNTIRDCILNASGYIVNNDGQRVELYGGEIGTSEPFGASGAISSISTLIPYTSGIPGSGTITFTNFRFTAVTAAGNDVNFMQCPDGGFVYYAFNIQMPSYGNVPVELIGYNSGTHTMTLQICPEWTWHYYTNGGIALDTGTDFNTELQALTTIDGFVRTVIGTGVIYAKGYLFEKTHESICHLQDSMFLQSNETSVWDTPRYTSPLVGMTDAGGNRVSCSWGWVRQGLARLEFKNIAPIFSGPTNAHPVLVGNTVWNGESTNEIRFRGVAPYNMTLRLFGETRSVDNTIGEISYDDTLTTLTYHGSNAGGFAYFERTPFGPNSVNNQLQYPFLKNAGGTSDIPFLGFRPHPAYEHRVTSADVASFYSPSGDYRQGLCVCGGQLLKISDLSTAGASHVIDKGGNFLTYTSGTNFAVTWTTKGLSSYLTVTGGADRNYMFPGLQINITTDSLNSYVITGVDYDSNSHVVTGLWVHSLSNTPGSTNVSGVKTTVYSDTIVSMRSMVLSYPGQRRSREVVSDFNTPTNGSLAAVTNLTHNVSKGLVYVFEVELKTTSNVAAGIQAAIGGTATFSAIEYYGYNQVTSSMTLAGGVEATALNTAVGGVTAVTASRVIIKGTATCSATGTMTVTAGQNAANAAPSVVLIGSTFDVWETH